MRHFDCVADAAATAFIAAYGAPRHELFRSPRIICQRRHRRHEMLRFSDIADVSFMPPPRERRRWLRDVMLHAGDYIDASSAISAAYVTQPCQEAFCRADEFSLRAYFDAAASACLLFTEVYDAVCYAVDACLFVCRYHCRPPAP